MRIFSVLLLTGCTWLGASDVASFYDRDGDGHRWDEGDCNDGDAAMSPGAAEVCGGGDEDCDGSTDEPGAEGEVAFYRDADDDGYGDDGEVVWACVAPTGYVAREGDCADDDPAVHPGAAEICNEGVDDDCDGAADDDDPDLDVSTTSTWYADNDGDGYGGGEPVAACAAPEGHIARGGDCGDLDGGVHPGALDVCSGVDEDCDDVVDPVGAVGLVTSERERRDLTAEWSGGRAGNPATPRVVESGVVSVCGGFWYVNVELAAVDVALLGYDRPTLHGASVGPVVSLSRPAATVRIEGFDLREGLSAAQGYDVQEGTGVTNHLGGAGSTVTLRDLDVRSTSPGGNLVYLMGGEVTAERIVVHGGRRGGMRVDDATITVRDSTFSQSQYVGLDVRRGDAVVERTDVVDNNEHGANFTEGTATLREVSIRGTQRWDSLGGDLSRVRFEDGEIIDNGATAIYASKGDFTMVRSTVSRNGSGGHGAVFRSYNGTTLTLIDTVVEDNWADSRMIDMANSGAVTCRKVDGPARIVDNRANSGGAVWLPRGRTFTSEGCDFGSGDDDNAPFDVWVEASSGSQGFRFGDGATFTCTPDHTTGDYCR